MAKWNVGESLLHPCSFMDLTWASYLCAEERPERWLLPE